ncbi:MAG: hypothetical protein GY705_26745 [Bacteroidetes bacterium]|nr:hypothetical protein [Bacteroidota bacterium]
MKFGFLTDKREIDCEDFSIKPVTDFDETISQFYESAKVSNGWIYGPEVELKKNNREEKKFKNRGPICCDNPYHIKSTHEITGTITPDNLLRFLVIGYAFLQGVYLSPDSDKVLWKIPYEPGTLNGLLLLGNDYEKGMEQIYRYSRGIHDDELKQIFAIIHWYLIGQTYRFEWDKFEAQYKVLDGIYKLSKLNAKSHAQRPVILAEKFNLELPKWAELNKKKKNNSSSLSTIRNKLVHEAIYADKPIGYAHPNENYSLEFRSFNTKLICKILGIDTPYLKSIPGSRDRFAWDIKN